MGWYYTTKQELVDLRVRGEFLVVNFHQFFQDLFSNQYNLPTMLPAFRCFVEMLDSYVEALRDYDIQFDEIENLKLIKDILFFAFYGDSLNPQEEGDNEFEIAQYFSSVGKHLFKSIIPINEKRAQFQEGWEYSFEQHAPDLSETVRTQGECTELAVP